MSQQECTDFQFKHGSLKEILEEMYKLQESGFKRTVFGHLKDGLRTYCGETYLNAFYKDEGDLNYGGSILLLTQAGQKVCEAILQRPSLDRRAINTHSGHTDCIQKYAEALQACLPKTFPALFFLFFNCDSGCTSFGGGSWNSYNVNDSGQNLYNWLIGGSDDDDFIARGFLQGELHKSNNGQNVAQELKKAVSLKPSKTEGSLQNVLCGFMFVCSWDDALTGHACLFLSTFCSEILGDPESLLKGPYKDHSEAFKEVCRGLKSDLKPFIDGSSGLSAVCHGNTNLFDTLWDDGKFLTYCDWLKRNIYRIIASLISMPFEFSQWSSNHLMSATSAGPFKYGFVFKDNEWNGNINSKLPKAITPLIESLEKLEKALQTSSSAAATAGGVFTGLFGLGGAGAGAAYGLNLFGFKNLVTGLISGFLK